MATDTLLKEAKKAISTPARTKTKEPIYFSTGHTLLDLVVGGGEGAGFGMGYLAGSVVRCHGNSGSSKSFQATELVAANYYKYGSRLKWRYCDPELGNTLDTESLYGINIIPKPTKNERPVITAEDWDYDLHLFLDSLHPENGDVGIYVLDSLDALSSVDTESRKEDRRNAYAKDKEFKDGTYGMGQAKFLSQEFFRGLTRELEEKNAILYIVSQERDNVNAGMYAQKWTVAGGKAVSFYESVRCRAIVKQKEEVSGRAVSVVIQMIAEKVRHPRPFRDCFVTIHFTYGMDSLGDELDFLYGLRSGDTGKLLKKAESITWDGSDPMNRESMIQYIADNGLRDELKKRVIEEWDRIEKSIEVKRPSKYGN